MRLQGTTICVADVSRSKAFYESVLGFQPGEFYEPTQWQPYWFEGQFFGIREVDSFSRQESFDITNFKVGEVEKLWNGVKDRAQVVDELATTPWGSYRFVVKDPDGYLSASSAKTKVPTDSSGEPRPSRAFIKCRNLASSVGALWGRADIGVARARCSRRGARCLLPLVGREGDARHGRCPCSRRQDGRPDR